MADIWYDSNGRIMAVGSQIGDRPSTAWATSDLSAINLDYPEDSLDEIHQHYLIDPELRKLTAIKDVVESMSIKKIDVKNGA